MSILWKRSGTIILACLAVLASIWILSNMLIDVELDGYGEQGEEAPAAAPSPGTLRQAFDLLPAEGGADSRIALLNENPEAWAERWRLISDARDSLEISYFILKSDIFGVSFLGHLLKKANEGVRIRILLDAIGTKMSREITGHDYLDTLVGTGHVSVKMYRPFRFRLTDAFLTLNPAVIFASDHDKILIADKRLALMGGRNIAPEYLAAAEDYPRAFRDTDLLLGGGRIGAVLAEVFSAGFNSGKAREIEREAIDIKDSGAEMLLAYEAMDAWLRNEPISEIAATTIRKKGLSWIDDLEKLPRLRGALRRRPAPTITAEVRLLDSHPRLLNSADPISRSLVQIARAARHDIFVQSPYFILSRHAVAALRNAAERGVRITVLTNSPVSSDNALSQALFLEQWPEVLAHVPTLRLFVAGDIQNIHGKLGAIDGQLALVGTYNLDPLSMSLNGELMAAVWSDRFVNQLLAKPLRLIAGGPPHVYEYLIVRDANGRPKRNRDGEAVIRFGPDDHSDPVQWKSVQWRRKLVRLVKILPGSSKLFFQ